MRIMHISRASIMVCQFLMPLIEEQKRRGHYVCVCGSEDTHAQKLRDAGIDVFTHKLRRSLNPFSIIKAIFQIKRILVREKIDVAICHTPIGAGVGRIAARLAKTRHVIYFVHGYTCVPAQNKFKWLVWFSIEKMLGYVTDAVLVMNKYDEQLCRSHHLVKDARKIFCIPGMGVDLDKFSASDNECGEVHRKLGIADNTKVVLSVAYLIPEKGIFVFLDAAKQICSQRDDVCFLLAGDGPYMERLSSRRDSYNLQNEFRVLGWRDDIYRLMRAANIFVLPTYYFEGLPVSILEAMACGKPVVATQHRGCEDAMVDGQTGYLVPVKKAVPLVDKIRLLLDNEQLRIKMGKAGRQLVERRFELNYCTERIIEALEKAC